MLLFKLSLNYFPIKMIVSRAFLNYRFENLVLLSWALIRRYGWVLWVQVWVRKYKLEYKENVDLFLNSKMNIWTQGVSLYGEDLTRGWPVAKYCSDALWIKMVGHSMKHNVARCWTHPKRVPNFVSSKIDPNLGLKSNFYPYLLKRKINSTYFYSRCFCNRMLCFCWKL